MPDNPNRAARGRVLDRLLLPDSTQPVLIILTSALLVLAGFSACRRLRAAAPPAEAVRALTAQPARTDLNTANWIQLTALSGIGEKRAKAIVRWRAEHGAFDSVDDLARVPGIPAATVRRLRPRLTVTPMAGHD